MNFKLGETSMKKLAIATAGLLAGGLVQADNLDGVDKMICAAAQVQICIESDACYAASAAELGVPSFVIIDTKKKTISTTKASAENRSTAFSTVFKNDGIIYLQGFEGGRAFSFVIEEAGGHMTVSVARDGVAVNVFGACTDSDL
ncbi:MAG: hypothetical protein KC572_04275 [Gammaproteobacteria bacterium]|nr:hypothetical protein [Gammaproteobacteria bacterium]